MSGFVTNLLELRQLRYFVVLAEELNFTSASARLHITQQALSTSVRQLEARIGVALVRRNTRSVELTEAGQNLRDDAARLLVLADATWRRARTAAEGERAPLRIAYTPDVGLATLQDVQRSLRAHAEGLRAQGAELGHDRLLAAVLRREHDVAIAFEPDSREGLESRSLWSEPLVLVPGSGHPLAGASAVAVSALGHDVDAVLPRGAGPGYRDALIAVRQTAGRRPTLVEVDTVPDRWAVAAFADGDRAAVVPRSVGRELAGLGIEPVGLIGAPSLALKAIWSAAATAASIRPLLQAGRALSAEKRVASTAEPATA